MSAGPLWKSFVAVANAFVTWGTYETREARCPGHPADLHGTSTYEARPSKLPRSGTMGDWFPDWLRARLNLIQRSEIDACKSDFTTFS